MTVQTIKYGGLNRDSKEEARTVCERILPNSQIRREVLTTFVEMIELCNAQGAAKWGISLYPGDFCLNVCGFRSCWAKPGEFNVAVMTEAMSPENWTILDARTRRGGPYKRIPGSEFLYIPLEQTADVLPLVNEAMRQFVLVTATKYNSMGRLVEGAHSPGFLTYLSDTLGVVLPEPSYRQRAGTHAAWKIAPGEDAHLWPECLAKSAIGIGWLPETDYTEFADKRTIQDALATAGGKERGADSILRFVKEIEPGSIVVANKGNNVVVGIGVITSEYLPPAAPDNPNMSYKHARRVDWRVTHRVTMPPAFFGQIPQTVLRLRNSKWQQIRHAYLDAYPNDADLRAALESLSDMTSTNPPIVPINAPTIPQSVKLLLEITQRTKNILLYGPPGTGKTWTVNHFANYFLLKHNISEAKANEYWQAVVNKDNVTQKALQEQVRAKPDSTEDDKINFWWITANEKEWTWSTLFNSPSKDEFFDKRRLAKNFEMAQPGDVIFGYLARPHKQIVALAQVKHGLHTRDSNGKTTEGILIEPYTKSQQMLQYPIKWQDLLNNPTLKQSEPMKNRAQGTLFHLTDDEAQEMIRLLTQAGNKISLPSVAPPQDFMEFVTFHQAFAYEEFMEGLKPQSDSNNQITYPIVDGVFKRISTQAIAHPDKQYLLVIDEINRANIAKVLGELITLVEDDKRLGAANELRVTLPYSGETFGVPSNLTILGTMNTADRSIALLDLALRRRFTFVEMPPQADLLDKDLAGVDLSKLLLTLNARVTALLDKDHQIGHSYLMNLTDADGLRFAWYNRLVPLLQEYFYHDGERLQAVLGKTFVQEIKLDDATRKALGDAYDDAPKFEVNTKLDDAAFLTALQELAAQTQTGGNP